MIEAVEVRVPGDLVLRGQVRRRGPDWVTLVHAPGEDIDAWLPLPDRIAAQGMSVLALDLRGHGGSDGSADPGAACADIRAAIGHARGEGAARVFVGAAGASVPPALDAASAERCDGLFALAPTGEPPVTCVPRFAVVGSRDPEQDAAGSTLVNGPGWSVVARIPVDARDCSLLTTSWGSHVVDYVLAFLRDQRRLPRPAVA
jgi:pimeloyl-ACP methyl ester carboxylesterase